MPTPSFTLILLIACCYPIYQLWKSISYRWAVRKAGCSLPKRYKHIAPFWGLDLVKKRVESMKLGNKLALDNYLFSTYGKTVQTNSWGTKQYVTMDPQNIQTICATHVDKFGAAPLNSAISQPFLGDGIMNTDGAQWKRSRNLLNPVFARSQIAELSSFEVHLNRLIEMIPLDTTVDMQPLFKMLFLDANTEFIFGKSANSLAPETSSPIARRLPTTFDAALRGMRRRFILGKLGFLAGGNKEYARNCRETHEIVDSFVDEECELQKLEREKGDQNLNSQTTPYNYVLLKELVRTTDDRKFVRNELMNVFFPARDTAATMTGNIVFLLARHPKVWDTLREEFLSIGDRHLNFELLKSMKYLQAVMNEGLRILNPVARSWKTCLEACVLPHGGGPTGKDPILVQPGDQVDMAFGALHIDPDIWGEDALEFKPERWAGLKQSWNFIPFLGGRRICPAQQNILTDMSYVLVRLMQRFKTCRNRDDCMEYVEEFVFTKGE
ncbi:hypothetical protein HYALB_00001250 [Hymenoscyphus albidus]|uniref:Uncharacterized protein n=1 Tax=Hymenoscyphus albidus TaxID=595503 RepID=A0A9N9LJS9_9HELO|nr:hypothetical protein HYALB_00001250 [Hymenoscyphus albidus]